MIPNLLFSTTFLHSMSTTSACELSSILLSWFMNFLDSVGKILEHEANVLKNSEKINSMDLNSLFGNLLNYKHTKALHKDIMKDSIKENFIAFFLERKQ